MGKFRNYLIGSACFLIFVFGAYWFGLNQQKEVNSVVKSIYVAPTNTPTPKITPIPTPISKSEELWQKVKREATDKVKVVDVKGSTDEVFKKNDIVRMDSGLVVTFINNTHTIQPYYPNSGETYIVDISLINLSPNMKSQHVFYDNFEIQDSSGRTYRPYLSYRGEGDVTGEIKPLEYKRGEICFTTPLQNINYIDYEPKYANNVSYVFKIRTDQQTISFKMNNQRDQEP